MVEILAPDGFEPILHVHHQEDEGFYILEGELTFYVGEQTKKAHPDTYFFGPKDVPHAFTVDSGPARLLFVFSPAGLEGLVRKMGEPARSLVAPPSAGTISGTPTPRCCQLEAHLTYVQKCLGHSSVQLTLDRYTHWMPSMGLNTAQRIDEALGWASTPAFKSSVALALHFL